MSEEFTNMQEEKAKMIKSLIDKSNKYNEHELYLPEDFFTSEMDRKSVAVLLNHNEENLLFYIDNDNIIHWRKEKADSI